MEILIAKFKLGLEPGGQGAAAAPKDDAKFWAARFYNQPTSTLCCLILTLNFQETRRHLAAWIHFLSLTIR